MTENSTESVEIEFAKQTEFKLPENYKHDVFYPKGQEKKTDSKEELRHAQQMTYKLMSYVSSHFLNPHFHSSFKNLFKILFLSDKIIQHSLALTFRKLHRGKVTSILFAVSSLLTMFTSCMKQHQNWGSLYKLWDLILGGGYGAVYKFLIRCLELQ